MWLTMKAVSTNVHFVHKKNRVWNWSRMHIKQRGNQLLLCSLSNDLLLWSCAHTCEPVQHCTSKPVWSGSCRARKTNLSQDVLSILVHCLRSKYKSIISPHENCLCLQVEDRFLLLCQSCFKDRGGRVWPSPVAGGNAPNDERIPGKLPVCKHAKSIFWSTGRSMPKQLNDA